MTEAMDLVTLTTFLPKPRLQLQQNLQKTMASQTSALFRPNQRLSKQRSHRQPMTLVTLKISLLHPRARRLPGLSRLTLSKTLQASLRSHRLLTSYSKMWQLNLCKIRSLWIPSAMSSFRQRPPLQLRPMDKTMKKKLGAISKISNSQQSNRLSRIRPQASNQTCWPSTLFL